MNFELQTLNLRLSTRKDGDKFWEMKIERTQEFYRKDAEDAEKCKKTYLNTDQPPNNTNAWKESGKTNLLSIFHSVSLRASPVFLCDIFSFFERRDHNSCF